MRISTKTIWTIVTVLILFILLWLSQLFYFDSLTEKFSVKGGGPVFDGKLSENVQSVVTRPFVLVTPEESITLQPHQIKEWIEPYHRTFTRRTEFRVNQDSVLSTIDDFAPGLDIKPSNARFGFVNGEIIESTPAKYGQKLDIDTSRYNIVQALIRNESSASLAFSLVEPELHLAKLHDLGITTRLGEGSSQFTGSPASRIHNINVSAKKMTNFFVAPGETFSFTDNLGDVDASTGYLPELIIKGDKLVYEYGGGVCQVSTTMFRAAIYAGLKIVERRAHSLPVRYYSPQGFDSTVYPGVVDLKFMNDTPGTILVQSKVQGTNISYEIFGSSDGRSVALLGPTIYESNPDGSLKAFFTRTITKQDGTSDKESFYSSYKSPGLYTVVKNPLE